VRIIEVVVSPQGETTVQTKGYVGAQRARRGQCAVTGNSATGTVADSASGGKPSAQLEEKKSVTDFSRALARHVRTVFGPLRQRGRGHTGRACAIPP